MGGTEERKGKVKKEIREGATLLYAYRELIKALQR